MGNKIDFPLKNVPVILNSTKDQGFPPVILPFPSNTMHTLEVGADFAFCSKGLLVARFVFCATLISWSQFLKHQQCTEARCQAVPIPLLSFSASSWSLPAIQIRYQCFKRNNKTHTIGTTVMYVIRNYFVSGAFIRSHLPITSIKVMTQQA